VTQFVALTRPSWIATLRLAPGLVMSHSLTQREAPKLNRVLAAHERRARLIAQLHEQAIATAYDLSAQRKATRASVAKNAQRRKVEAWLFSANAFLLALGCIVAVGCILAICL
jgi:acyl transferase domain-containing protein